MRNRHSPADLTRTGNALQHNPAYASNFIGCWSPFLTGDKSWPILDKAGQPRSGWHNGLSSFCGDFPTQLQGGSIPPRNTWQCACMALSSDGSLSCTLLTQSRLIIGKGWLWMNSAQMRVYGFRQRPCPIRLWLSEVGRCLDRSGIQSIGRIPQVQILPSMLGEHTAQYLALRYRGSSQTLLRLL